MLKARESGTEEKLKTSPVAVLKTRMVEQTRQIAHLEEQLAAAENRDSSLFDLKRHKPEDIGAVIVGTVSENKAREIVKAITATLTSKQRPAG